MNNRNVVFRSLAAVAFAVAVAAALSGGHLALAQGQSEGTKEGGVVQVEAKYVCMINEQRFNKEQIAVEVEGRTYYGCCEMCKAKLRDDSGSRTATDPVSGKKVDKAKAVIGADAEGKVYYFENSDNLNRFKAGWKTPEGE